MAPNSQHRIKLWLHVSAALLMAGAVGVALLITMNPVMLGGAKRTPMAARVGMSLGGKGLIFLLYQILTENVRACKRFASTKANLILNCIESVGWPAAVGVTIYGMLQFCIGISCTLSYVMIALSVFLSLISWYSAWISLREHKAFKATGVKPGDMKLETMDSADSNQAFNHGNGVSIHQNMGKTPEPVHHAHGGGRPAQNQNQSQNPFVAPSSPPRQHYSQRQEQHYQHNQSQYYQQPQAEHYQQQYPRRS